MHKNRIGRFYLSDITLARVFSALKVRLNEIPHSLTWSFSALANENKNKIKEFHQIHKGKRCFIIANGPSLKKTNLDFLKNEYSFGLNRIYLNFKNSTFRPTYYIAVNELILEQWSNEILQLNMPKFLNWNRRLHFGNIDSNSIFLKSKITLKDTFQYDMTRPLVFGATVTFVALQLAYYMGFQKVILVGLDHNYSDKGIPSKTETRLHDQDVSHFHPNYFPKGYKWQLPDLLRSEIEFDLSRKIFESDKREILDATFNGKCKIFEKINYLSLFC